MNKQALQGQREYFKMIHGVTLRLMASFGDDGLDFRPKPEMRSARELFAHMYGMEKIWAEDIGKGKITQESENRAIPESAEGKAEVAKLKTVADLQAFARAAHQALDDALNAITDEELAANVETPFGTYPAWQMFAFAYDEHWHHRGQLYTYARLAGKDAPMLYDYEHNISAAA
ncbi:MAG TPA: DinB family protein [Blastocatellia bacterium]|nr:DinB family protein [Blastocatellia bacterium]